MPIKRALISVSDKTGIEDVSKKLSKLGIQIISTGGTAKAIKDAGVDVTDVSEVTGFPEIMEGRVKTLHPKVHGGLLAVRDSDGHMKEASENEIEMIDLVIVNLYPFSETVAKDGVTEDEAIENIDIGGPSMLRSAAKNYKYVTVVTDPEDYSNVLSEIEADGDTKLETRKKLARKVFTLTYEYDEAINRYFRELLDEPELMDLHYEKVRSLRYGENPTQKAAFFRSPKNQDSNITNAEVMHGKELSFNNIVDGDSALELVKEFKRPTAVFVKHNNPCGVATREDSDGGIEAAFEAAHKADPLSAFGCVVAVNREFTEKMVDYIKGSKMFMEIIIAPSFTEKALKRLMTRKNLRILRVGDFKRDLMKTDIKKVTGGILIQTKDTHVLEPSDLKVVTKLKPTDEQIADMLFATRVVKRVVSNSVVMAKGLATVGVGAGQMSRVDSVFIAGHKAGDRSQGAVMSSDAFFPFPDGIEQAAKYGIKAIIHPGGSIRDEEVIARADELGIAMVFSGRRYFKH
jgi:phosphoribosylaminoimidazolecarboxamide formyltransferase / IMP cyclohydrolase